MMFFLDQLPEEVLLNIVSCLEDNLDDALSIIPCVCRAWCNAMDGSHLQFWRGLATSQGIHLPQNNNIPRATHTRRTTTTRLAVNPKRAFMKRRKDITTANSAVADKLIWKIWLQLHNSDCAALVRKTLVGSTTTTTTTTAGPTTTTTTTAAHSPNNNNTNTPNSSRRGSFQVDHRLHFYENRTLLMLASWRGRTRVVKELLNHGASIYAEDDRGATSLLLASWAGQTAVVKLLLSHHHLLQKQNNATTTTTTTTKTSTTTSSVLSNTNRKDLVLPVLLLDRKGVPPMSSSCGGRGPKTALCWAERKGFQDIVQILEQAGADTSHRI